jgi:hypothetical protein
MAGRQVGSLKREEENNSAFRLCGPLEKEGKKERRKEGKKEGSSTIRCRPSRRKAMLFDVPLE